MAKAAPDFKPVIDYFLSLFKMQVAGETEAVDAASAAIFSDKPGRDVIYELNVRHRGTDRTRRMSIRSLGEQVESKSMCYKIIYDDLIVVKIPPRPITHFDVYLNHIHQEHAIADRLTPSIACVYPHLGAILKKVPSLRLPADFPPDQVEREYIERLTREPHYQKYLQIAGGFVFFMSLSQYRFFNQVIDSIHFSKDLVRQEILRNGPGAIADMHAFETLYGACNDGAYFDMHALMKAYERSIEEIISNSGATLWIADYQVQEWFFQRLAGSRPDFENSELPPDLAVEIDAVTTRMLSAKKALIDEFHNIVHAAVRRQCFDKNRARVKGLSVKVIELLYRLKNRSVSIRDLKPDNMYVAAQLDGADHILADPNAYDLGLIDLETAVCFDLTEGSLPQPLLAGTPSYATPTHVFNNRILGAVFRNELPRVFYLQDWYAGLVMIFNILTGRPLFVKTARLMPEISRMKKKDARNERNPRAVFENGSRIFWKTASEELNDSLKKNQERLRDVEIALPDHLANFLVTECRTEHRLIDSWVAGRIDQCRPAEKYREKLIAASHSRIRGIIAQAHENPGSGKGREDFIGLLSRIEPLKRWKEDLEPAEQRLSAPVPSDFLIAFLFNRVHHAMCRPEWSEIRLSDRA